MYREETDGHTIAIYYISKYKMAWYQLHVELENIHTVRTTLKSGVDLSTTYQEVFMLSTIGTCNGAWIRHSLRAGKSTNLEQDLNEV